MSLTKLIVALGVLALAIAGCGGDEGPSSGITEVEQLEGRTIGVSSLDSVSTLELRYVLQEIYGMGVQADVSLVEAPAQELLAELRDGNVDAVVLPPSSSIAPYDEDEFRVLVDITREMRLTTQEPVPDTLLLSYPDVVTQKPAALEELNRMLRSSISYLDSNRSAVVAEVAVERDVDEESAQAWWGPRRIAFGDTSDEIRSAIATLWEVAELLGDISEVPEVADLIVGIGEAPGVEVPSEDNGEDTGDRITLALALLDDVSRRAALYAIEHGIVTSDLIDLDITYLPRRELSEAAPAREFDVVEATPLAVPLGIERDLALMIVSGGALDLEGTLLLVRAE